MMIVMPHNASRAKLLRENTTRQERDAGGVDALPKAKLIVKGKVIQSPIYQFRLSDLYYNKANGRIKAEVAELEAQFARQLDMADEKDRDCVRSLLLSIRRDENDKIREDLRKNGQLIPGIVTCDGIIINGNRRHAILEELHRGTHDQKFNCLDAHVLPSDITKSEVWLIEAGIQLSAPQQLDYSPINHLLKVREGIDAGLNVTEMAQRIYGVDEARLQRDLLRLKLIDQYLEDFLKKKGRYHLVNGLAEHFIDLQNIIEWVERPRGKVHRDWQPDSSDIEELKLVAFYYIRARFPHMRVRDLRNLFFRKNAWKYLSNALDIETTTDTSLQDSELMPDETEEDSEPEIESSGDSVSIGGEVVEADRRTEKAWHNQAVAALKSNFEDAMEQQKIEQHKEKPLDLAKRALRQLEGIPERASDLADPGLDHLFSRIIIRVNQLRKLIAKHNGTPTKSRARSQPKAAK